MDIREIHIEHFGCWQDVSIRSLSPGLNIIHLDDGARPVEFAEFVNGMLFGFASDCPVAAGTLVFGDNKQGWSLERDQSGGLDAWQLIVDSKVPRDQTDQLEKLRGESVSARLVSSPGIPPEERWTWLARNPSFLPDNKPGVDLEPLQATSQLSLVPHGKVLERLGEEREELLNQISSIRRHATVEVIDPTPEPVQPEVEKQPNARGPADKRILIAELKDELRRLRQQIEPLRAAIGLADRWNELRELESTKKRDDTVEVGSLERALSELRSLDEERRLAVKPPPKRKKKRRREPARRSDDSRSVRKLLAKREWVLDQTTADELANDDEHAGELQHAMRLFEKAETDHRRLLRQLHEFNSKTGFDWSTALVDDHSTSSEIGDDSPLAHEPPERQLAELKRRRLWVREEFRYLAEKQETTQVDIWITILFILSVASLFGTLLIASPAARWTLTAMGFGGIVCSGALKMALDLRAARNLARSQERLHRLDREILMMTERVLGDRQQEELLRRRTQEKLHALQLQQDVSEAERRADSAEVGFRELLDRCGLPVNLNPDEARKALRRKSTESDGIGDPKLRRWIHRARSLVRRGSRERPASDPLTLLQQLDELLEAPPRKEQSVAETEIESRVDRREQLSRIERRQNAILRKTGFEDAYALESAIRRAKLEEDRRGRASRLRRELTIAIEGTSEPTEVRELLDGASAADLNQQYDERQRVLAETERALAHHESAAESTAEPVERTPEQKPPQRIITERKFDATSQHRLDLLRMQLSVVETRFRYAMRAAQSGAILKQLAPGLLSAASQNASSGGLRYLPALTQDRWQSIGLEPSGQFLLYSGDETQPLEPDSESAAAAWLAIQLDVAGRSQQQGAAAPLVLFADELLASPAAGRIFSTLQLAADEGIQMLLLVGGRQLANQLAETDVPAVRVLLQEEPPKLRVVNAG